MRIKKLQLGGHDIQVVYVPTVRDPETGAEIFGLCDPLQNIISIAEEMKGVKLAEDVLLHSLCHEIVHYILMIMSEGELNGNEPFVDKVGSYLHQWLKTMVVVPGSLPKNLRSSQDKRCARCHLKR